MKISRFYALLATLLFALAPRVAGAMVLVDLLAATVPVVDQSDAERERGFRAGLGQVAVKLTGQRAVLNDPGVAQLVATAPQLVERYDYVEVPAAGSDPNVGGAPGFLLQVSFSASAVDAALRRLHVPLWPAQRPQLLLLASGSEADSAAVIELARRVLANRGVPVLEPLWDLEDRKAIGATHAGFDADRIEAVAQRYGTSHWLALDPAVGADGVRGRWRLGGTGAPASATPTAESLMQWVEASVGDAVDQLAARLAYLPQTGTATQTLVIEDVRSYGAYRAVLETLGTLEFIREIAVTAMAAGRLHVELQLDGDPNLLWTALDGNPRFAAVVPEIAAAPAAQFPVESTTPSSDASTATSAANSTAETAVQIAVPTAEPVAKPAVERRYLWREP